MKIRVPLRYITVFGVSALIALAVGIVFFLGFFSAAKNTRHLMSDQARGLISSMERDISMWLQPVNSQAAWVARHVLDNAEAVSDLEQFDAFMLGALAGTSQVAGMALVTPDGLSRRWTRASGEAITEDWSSREEIKLWIEDGKQRREPSWVEPFFTDTIDKTILLHDLPIHGTDGELLAILAQIVPIEELSNYVVDLTPREGMTPFILYGEDLVLAHPMLIEEKGNGGTAFKPMTTLTELDDHVLKRIWTPDDKKLYFLEIDNDIMSSGVFIETSQRYFIYLYKRIEDYGPIPWIIGAHLNTDIYGGDESKRLIRALIGSIAVLLVAIAGAILLGRYITRPVTAIAEAARLVEADRLEEVPVLASSHMQELDDAARSFNQMLVDLRERTLIRQTLGQFVPEEVARTLLSKGGSLQSETAQATLLYSDIEGFTALTESLGATKVVAILNAYFSAMVEALESYQGVVTQFHGDAILATFNVPIANPEHAESAIMAASKMLAIVNEREFAGHRLRIRMGIASGPVVAGAVGAAGRLSYTVYGNPVNLAARLERLNKEFGTGLLVSENTARLAGECVKLRAIGKASIRGQAEKIKIYTLAEKLTAPE
ncbi:MAG: adenylate/guanylate cyclase domain-containing protein [Granulosicoccus sp.]